MMILRELLVSDESDALLATAELDSEGHGGFLLMEPGEVGDFAKLVNRSHNQRLGIDLPEGKVPATFWVAEIDGQIAGRISIRHELNDFLANYGGHIGYMVRPSFRRRGVATEMLKRALAYCSSLGLTRVLLTCFDENHGSIKVIEAAGGTLDNTVSYEGKLLRRYWISISTSAA